MIETVKDLAVKLENDLEPYEKVAIDGYLTEEGRHLLDVYCDLLDITPFYDDLFDYFQDEAVIKLLQSNKEIRQIKHLIRFSKRFQ